METKVCSKCKVEKSLTFFNKRIASKDGYSSYCKQCNSESLKNHYYSNKEYYYNKSRNYYLELKEWFINYKQTLKCSKCGESRHWVLDFHHKDPSIKDGTIAQMLINSSRENLIQEIDKCDVLCANCHRDLHYQERQNIDL